MEVCSWQFFIIFFVVQLVVFFVVHGIKNAIKDYIDYLTQMKFDELENQDFNKHLDELKKNKKDE